MRRIAAAAGLALLGGCAAGPEVQTLATGRADVSAYLLDGSDIEQLRQQARRLCPLGGEVLRQSSQGGMPPEAADGRWRRAWQATAQWVAPPQAAAQLVITCREPGDRMRLEPPERTAVAAPPTALPGLSPLTAAVAPAVAPPTTPTAAAAVPARAPALQAALPVGPITPEW